MTTWTLKLRTLNSNLVRGLLLPVDQNTLDLKALDQVTQIEIDGLTAYKHVSVGADGPIVTENAEHLTPQKNDEQKWEESQGDNLRYLLALDSLYRQPGSLTLEMLREGEEYSALLLHAAWSALVFDAEPTGSAAPALSLRLGDTPTTCDVKDGRATLTRNVRSLEPRQSPHGFALALSLGPEEIGRAVDGEHSVRVDRWVGAAPLGPPTYSRLARLPSIPAEKAPPALETVDPLGPDEFVGCQLHYAVTLIDGHLREVYSGMASVLRERLDVPSAPADVSFHVTLENLEATGAILDFAWPGGRDDAPERLGIMLLSETRGLDACGFYGGADDLALLAGLGALDLSVAQDHLQDLELHIDAIQRDRLAGKWATTGLRPRFVWRAAELVVVTPDPKPTADSTAKPPERFRLTIPEDKLVAILPQDKGRRFHLCAVRIPRALESSGDLVAHAPKLRNSAVAPCAHTIEQQNGPVPVFQIERVLPPIETWLHVPEFAPTVVDQKGDTPPWIALRIVDAVPNPEDPSPEDASKNKYVPAGGFELWLRDRIGENDPSPFQYVATVQSLPPLVASYRPPPLNGATPWAPKPLDPAGTVGPPLTDWAKLDDTRSAFAKAVDGLTNRDSDPLRRARPRRTPKDDVADPATVMERFFGKVDAEVSLGAIFSALAELGLAELLILPLQKVQKIRTDGQTLEATLGEYANDTEVCLWGMTDPQGHPFATIAVVQPMNVPATKPFDTSKSLEEAWTNAHLEHRVKVLTLGAMDLETRAFAEDRSFTYEWNGLRDRWCHELEWAIRRLDRYHQIRNSLGTTELEARRPRPKKEVVQSQLVRVPRTAPVADVIDVTQDLSVDPSRLVFRYTDPPERRAAARNAFDAVRLGELSVVHQMTRQLHENHRSLATRLPGCWAQVEDAEPWAYRFEVRRKLEPLVDSDRFDFGVVPPYYDYQISAFLMADGMSAPIQVAGGRVESDRLGLPTRPVIKVILDGAHFELSVQLWCAKLYHSTTASDPSTVAQVLDVGEKATLIGDLPDLDVEYRIYLNTTNPLTLPPRLLPVFSARLETEPDQGVVLRPVPLLEGCQVDASTLGGDGKATIVAKLAVGMRPALDRVLEARAKEHASPDTAYYFELVRGRRATGPHPYRGNP